MMKFNSTPWGAADHVTEVTSETTLEGVWFVSTPSHGGFFLDAERNEKIPGYIRAETFNGLGEFGWYEEDMDVNVVAIFFPDLFPEWGETAEIVISKARARWNAFNKDNKADALERLDGDHLYGGKLVWTAGGIKAKPGVETKACNHGMFGDTSPDLIHFIEEAK